MRRVADFMGDYGLKLVRFQNVQGALGKYDAGGAEGA